MIKTTQYFCDKNKLIFNAINIELGYFTMVILMNYLTEIHHQKGKNSANLRLSSCIENTDMMDSNELEFTEAIGKADELLHQTPYL